MTCVRCLGATKPHRRARGLCIRCYDACHHNGSLSDYPRFCWPRDELLTEWDFLRRQGFTMRLAATRLGVTYEALDRALSRAKDDPRAIRRAVS